MNQIVSFKIVPVVKFILTQSDIIVHSVKGLYLFMQNKNNINSNEMYCNYYKNIKLNNKFFI